MVRTQGKARVGAGGASREPMRETRTPLVATLKDAGTAAALPATAPGM